MDDATRSARSARSSHRRLVDAPRRWRTFDTATFAVQVAAAIFVVGGLLSLLTLAVLPRSWADPHDDWRVCVLAIGIGALGFLVPWSRLPVRAQLAYALAAL